MSKLVIFLLGLVFVFPQFVYSQNNSNTPQLVELEHLGRGSILDSQWSSDGSMIAVVGSKGLWLYTPEFELIKHVIDIPLDSVQWSENNHHLVISDEENNIFVLDLATENLLSVEGQYFCSTLSPDGQKLALYNPNHQIEVIGVNNNEIIFTYPSIGDANVYIPYVIEWFDNDTLGILGQDENGPQLRQIQSQSGQVLDETRIDNILLGRACSQSVAWNAEHTQFTGLANQEIPQLALFDTETGQLLAKKVDFYDEWTSGVSWKSDSSQIAITSPDSTVEILSVDTLEPIDLEPEISFREVFGRHIDWQPNGHHILVSDVGGAQIFDAESGVLLNTLYEHYRWTDTLGWSLDGQYLASGHGGYRITDGPFGDNRLRIWSQDTHQLVVGCDTPRAFIADLEWDNTGNYIFTSQFWEMTIRKWNWQDCDLEAEWHSPIKAQDFVRISVHPIDKTILVHYADTHILDENLELSSDLAILNAPFRLSSWSPDGSKIAFYFGSNVVIYDYNSQEIIAERNDLSGFERDDRSSFLYDAVWSSDGKQLALGNSEGRIFIWNIVTDKVIEIDTDNPTYELAWHPSQNLLISGHQDGTLRLWDLNDLTLLQKVEGSNSSITDMQWHPTENILATASYDQDIVLWELVWPE